MTKYIGPLAEGILTTLEITAASFAIGCVGGLLLVLAQRSRLPPLRWLATVYTELVRGIPPIAWLFLIFYGLAQGGYLTMGVMTAAITGFGAIASAYLGEIFRAAVGAVPRGQWEAASAVGLSRRTTYVRVILPQAFLVAIPTAATYAIGLLKESAIASAIGAHDIAFRAFDKSEQTFDGFNIFFVAALMYIALSLPIAAVARYTDRRLSRLRYAR